MELIAVHSSAELYGSDRSLLAICTEAATRLKTTVILPEEGPLATRLRDAGVNVTLMPLAVLRRSNIRNPREWVLFASALLRARGLGRRLRETEGLTILSNTTVVMSGQVLARYARAPHSQVVREIYASRIERSVFGRIIRNSKLVVFVSAAARDQFGPEVGGHRMVAPSGADLVHSSPPPRTNESADVRLVCVGRLSAWKGQDVLIDSIADLRSRGIPAVARIVGGEYGTSTEVTTQLREQCIARGVAEHVEFVGEVDSPTEHYLWADVVVVPSTRPEPFGKVVIEAMNAARPVVASAHGGPAEVLADGEGGSLFVPGDPLSLSMAVQAIVDPTRWPVASRQAFDKSLNYSASTTATRIVERLVAEAEER